MPAGATYAATIATTGTYIVTLSQPPAGVTVDSLTLNNPTATLLISSDVLNVVNNTSLLGGVLQLSSGTLAGGTLSNAGGNGVVRFDSGTNILNGVAIPNPAVLDLTPANSVMQLRGGTQIGPGNVTFGQGSAVYLNQTAATSSGLSFVLARNNILSAEGGNVATLGAATAQTVTVSVNPGAFQSTTLATNQLGANAATVLLNQGTIQFDSASANATLNITPGGGGQFQNAGIVSVFGTNTINLTGPFKNTGQFAVAGGTLNLLGSFTTSDLGSLNHTGGVVSITGNMNNAGGTFALTDTGANPTGSITLSGGGTITGGTITAAGTAKIQANGTTTNALVGVTLPASAVDLSTGNSLLQLRGNTTLTPGALPIGSGSSLYINQTAATQSGVSFNVGRNATLSARGW
jgi:hypothetical protein